ncbi:MAG: iron-containing redox enzyme family protein [Proteobacteria bacterium]|nr:iron-containing redox enzyme family protein [Pseudomonadota bacterium]
MDIKKYTADLSKQLLNCDTLRLMRSKKITPAQLKFYFYQKIRIAENFQQLLAIGIQQAEVIGDFSLAQTVRNNLYDETGRDNNGLIIEENSHAYWRTFFLQTLGINLNSARINLLPSTQAHLNLFLKLETTGNVFNIAGAVLMIEKIVPFEYRAIQVSRDFCFPEQFVLNDADTDAKRHHKLLARKYIDDHIKHDSQNHFPDLLKALQKYETNRNAIDNIKEGIDMLFNARMHFFNGISAFWSMTEQPA